MNMQYMIDTNICIFLMKNQAPQALRRLESLYKGDAVISIITFAELRAGIELGGLNRDKENQSLNQLIQYLPVLPFDKNEAYFYGRLRAVVKDRKRNSMDRLIAAHALSCGATLVTHNTRDFEDYPNLKIEDWMVLH
jgi:tRNA(fMet)-specific endonuclease VapC